MEIEREKCFICGHTLIIDGDWDSEDVGPDNIGRIVTQYNCKHCGYTYEVYSPTKDELRDYPYYKHRYETKCNVDDERVSHLECE